VDPVATLAKVKELFGSIPSHPLPEHPPVNLTPVKAESFTLDSNLPYIISFVAYRLPGTDSPDFAATQILSDVLASQRGDLYAMVPAGKALAAEFGVAETYPKASVGFGLVALPAGPKAEVAISGATAEMRKILMAYAEKGLPEELITAAKRSEIAAAEFSRNSIPGLASSWSEALAAQGRNSPEENIDAIKKVTVADVNRVAKQYLADANSISAILKPVPNGEAVADKGFGGGEKLTSAPTKPVELPVWAAKALSELKVPTETISATDTTLPNGIRLIVKTDATSPTVSLYGAIQHNSDLQTPPGQEGVSDLLDGLFSFKENFPRGVELLADNELHPALPADAFAVIQKQTSQFTAGNLESPGYRTSRALDLALLPKNDPELREATPATIDRVTLDQVKQLYAATFRPDLTTIVIIGDISAAEAKSVIEKYFGAWKATGPKPETTLPAIPNNKAATVSVPDDQQVQDSVTLAEQLSVNRFDPDYYPLQLGNHVLGGGFYATRLYHDLRQVSGYVYNVDVSLDASKTRASYAVTYGCNAENVSKARALIERDLNQMRTENVSDGELHQAKAILLRSLPLGEASEESVAGGLLRRAEIGLPLDEPNRAAKKYFDRQLRIPDLVQVVRGPAPK
jgi:zinc protease